MTFLACTACGGNLSLYEVPMRDAEDNLMCPLCILSGNVAMVPLTGRDVLCPRCRQEALPRNHAPARDEHGRPWCDTCAERAPHSPAVVAGVVARLQGDLDFSARTARFMEDRGQS